MSDVADDPFEGFSVESGSEKEFLIETLRHGDIQEEDVLAFQRARRALDTCLAGRGDPALSQEHQTATSVGSVRVLRGQGVKDSKLPAKVGQVTSKTVKSSGLDANRHAAFQIPQYSAEFHARSNISAREMDSEWTASRWRRLSAAVYCYARKIGMGRHLAKAEAMRAKAACQYRLGLPKGYQLDESDEYSTVNLDVCSAMKNLTSITLNSRCNSINPITLSADLDVNDHTNIAQNIAKDVQANDVKGIEAPSESANGGQILSRKERRKRNRMLEAKAGQSVSDRKIRGQCQNFGPHGVVGSEPVPYIISEDATVEKKAQKRKREDVESATENTDDAENPEDPRKCPQTQVHSKNSVQIKKLSLKDARMTQNVSMKQLEREPRGGATGALETWKEYTGNKGLGGLEYSSREGTSELKEKYLSARASGNSKAAKRLRRRLRRIYKMKALGLMANVLPSTTSEGLDILPSVVNNCTSSSKLPGDIPDKGQKATRKKAAGEVDMDFVGPQDGKSIIYPGISDSFIDANENVGTFSENCSESQISINQGRSLDRYYGSNFNMVTVQPKMTLSQSHHNDKEETDFFEREQDAYPSPTTTPAEYKQISVQPLAKTAKLTTKSPFFSEQVQSKSTGESKPRPRGGTRSCIPFPPLTASRFGLLQETLAHDPFRLLIGVTFLNRTAGKHAIPVFFELMRKYPTPGDILAADKEDIITITRHLGLQAIRAKTFVKYAEFWLHNPPVKDWRYRVENYPNPGDGKDIKKGEVLDDEDPRTGAWEIGHMTKGRYAIDSWRIFCRDILRGEAQGWNGEGREGAFQPEWMRVQPQDKELIAYLRWMWLKEGFEWDPVTNEKEVASRELLEAAMVGRVVWDDEGGMRILD